MGELWTVLAVSCGLAYVSEKYTLSWNGRTKRVFDDAIVCLLIAFLSLYSGLRTNYNDTGAYIAAYKEITAFPDILTGFDWQLGNNPGFFLLNSLMKAVGLQPQSFVLFYAVQFVASAVIFLKRYSRSFTLSIFLFVCVNGYLFSFAAMKQCAAIAIGLMAIPLLEKRKWILFVLTILAASTFHPYILLFLMLPILRFKPWSAGTLIMLAITVISARYLPRLVGTAVDMAALLGDGYDAEAFIGEGVNIFRVLVASVPVILTLVYLPNITGEKSEEIDYMLINGSFVFTCIMFVGLFGTANYFGRLANYFIVFPAAALPFIIKRLSGKDKEFFTVAMVVCYLAYFYYGNAMHANFAQEFRRITIWQYLTM